jgi:RNA polymerase sigma-70 factor (ECF subfamily)
MSTPPSQDQHAVPTTLSDEQVVARVCAGEARLFELLMRRHNQKVFRAARAILRRDSEAEDVMQDAYVRAYTHLSEFKGEARFSTWLTRVLPVRPANPILRRSVLSFAGTATARSGTSSREA